MRATPPPSLTSHSWKTRLVALCEKVQFVALFVKVQIVALLERCLRMHVALDVDKQTATNSGVQEGQEFDIFAFRTAVKW